MPGTLIDLQQTAVSASIVGDKGAKKSYNYRLGNVV
jgi:hypothetical protein